MIPIINCSITVPFVSKIARSEHLPTAAPFAFDVPLAAVAVSPPAIYAA